MVKQKESGSKGPKKELWTIQGLEKRCQELLEQGLLTQTTPDGDYEAFCAVINGEFAEQLTANGRRLTPHALKSRMPKLIWTAAARGELKRAIRDRSNLDDFHKKYFSYIPKGVWDRKAKFYKGLSGANESARFVAGVGRLITDELTPEDEAFEFPPNDTEHPLEIKAGAEWQIPVINGANIGIVYDANIEDNPLRRALSDMQKRGADAVILTNVIDINVKKTAGVSHIYKAPVSGLHIKLEHLPESYRERAARIMKDRPNDAVVYQNIAAKFLGLMDALYKITRRPLDKGFEYSGKVFYLLGYKDEELINEGANAELRYIRYLDAARLSTEVKAASRRLSIAEAYLEHKLSKKDRKHYEGRVRTLSKRLAEISEELAMSILTNVSDEDRNRFARRYRALLIKKLQQVIPNCTVITQGSAQLKINDKTMKVHIPSNVDVTDNHLASYVDNYGFDVFTDTLADITVICPPHSLNHRLVGREDSKIVQPDGKPVPVTKCIHVAPICVDDVFVRQALRGLIKKVHPVHKAVFDPQFKPGVLLVSCVNGIISADPLPVPKLARVAKSDVRNFAYPYPDTKYITWILDTDNHFGAPDKRYIWDPKDRIHLGVTEAMSEMARRLGVVNPRDIRVHCTAEMDDATQGDLWFKQRYRPDPNLLSKARFTLWLRQLTAQAQNSAEKGDTAKVVTLLDEVNKVVTAQQNFKGEDFPFHQMMEVFDQHLDPQADVYSAVLGRFVKSGITIQGISKIQGTMSDTRDLGAINFPEGNHRINTLEQADLEGDYMALRLQDRIALRPEWRKYTKEHPDFLRDMIRAPRFGNVTFGWGLVQAPGRYPWGVRVHATPARQSGWSDILAALVKNDLARGDDSYGLGKHVTITFLGDKHFYAKAETARMIYVMCAAGVHTNTYGSTGGFPPNNTGVCFVSIPADGPDAGPIIMRMLPHDYLRDWFANPKPFDWKKFLPEPV